MQLATSSSKKPVRRTLRAWVHSPETAECLEAAIGEIGDLTGKVVRDDDPLAVAASHPGARADIALVELTAADEDSIKKVELLAQAWREGSSFIVLLDDPTTEIVRRLFRAGISDVLPSPCSAGELAPTLMHASDTLDHEPPRGASGRIVTVLKAAGGVGASTFAANLAAEFAEQINGRVGLIDLDIQFGDLALYLDIKPRRTLLEALQAGARLDETLLHELMETHKSGVALLAAPPFVTPLDRVGEGFVFSLFRLLKSTFNVTVVELPAGWSDWFSSVFEQSDLLAVVSEPTVRGAAGLKRVMQCLDDLSFSDAPSRLIVNKVREGADARERINQLRASIRRDFEIVRYDEHAAGRANDVGELLREAAPKSDARRDVQSAAAKILAQMDMPVRAVDPREKHGFTIPFLGRRA